MFKKACDILSLKKLNTLSKAALFFILFAVSFSNPLNANPLPNADYDLFLDDVALDTNSAVDLHLRVYVNDTAACTAGFRTLFVVHGFAHAANTWEAFAEAAFNNNPHPIPLCRIVAIDQPGHGQSGFPSNKLYQDVSLQDYVSAVLGALDRLPEYGLRPTHVVGHSLGGLVVQLAQQRLVNEGSSFRHRYGVRKVTLLAPLPPAAVPWLLSESGAVADLASAFLVNDPNLGTLVFFPGPLFPQIFFSNFLGEIASGTPSVDVLNTYAFAEPLQASLELGGLPPVVGRPEVNALVFENKGLWSWVNGTILQLISFENDVLVLSGEGEETYRHLTGDDELRHYVNVSGPETVHDIYISDPATMINVAAYKVLF